MISCSLPRLRTNTDSASADRRRLIAGQLSTTQPAQCQQLLLLVGGQVSMSPADVFAKITL